MDWKVSPGDGIPTSCLGRTIRVQITVPRAGQKGYNLRTEINEKIYRMVLVTSWKTKNWLRLTPPLNMTSPTSLITPHEWIPSLRRGEAGLHPLEGCCIGPKKRVLTPSGNTPRRGLLRSLISSSSTPAPSLDTDGSRPHRLRHPLWLSEGQEGIILFILVGSFN